MKFHWTTMVVETTEKEYMVEVVRVLVSYVLLMSVSCTTQL